MSTIMSDDDILKRAAEIKKQQANRLVEMRLEALQKTVDCLGEKLGCTPENIGKVQREYDMGGYGYGSLSVACFNNIPYMFRMRLPNGYVLALGNKEYENDRFCLLPPDTPIDGEISYVSKNIQIDEKKSVPYGYGLFPLQVPNGLEQQFYEEIYELQQKLTEDQLKIIYRFYDNHEILSSNMYLSSKSDDIDWKHWQKIMDSILSDNDTDFNEPRIITKEIKTVYSINGRNY